jgi:Flp pilus assembly protein TadG
MKTRIRGNRRRGGARGVAIVEGAVVVTLLAIFLPLAVYGWTVFKTRVQIQGQTRQIAFFAAAHDCVSATSPTQIYDPHVSAYAGTAAGLAAAMPGSDGRGAHLASSPLIVGNDPHLTAQAQAYRFERTLTNTSYVLCNDQPEDGHWLLWLFAGEDYFARQYGLP